MLNFLRADLYRIVHQKLFWIFLLLLPVLVVSCTVVARLAGAGEVLASSVSLVPNMSDSGSVPLMLTLFFVFFVQSDSKQAAIKSLLVTPHARRDYVLSKSVALLIASFVYVLAVQAAMVLIGVLFSISIVPTDPLSVILGLVGMTLAGAAYAALGFALSVSGRVSSLVMVVAVLAVLGMFDFGIMVLLELASDSYPFLSPVFGAIQSILLTNATSPLSSSASVVVGPDLAFCMAVCLGYVLAATVAALLIMRRRDIS